MGSNVLKMTSFGTVFGSRILKFSEQVRQYDVTEGYILKYIRSLRTNRGDS